jgi:hypothetical protein
MRFEFDNDLSVVTSRWKGVNAAGLCLKDMRQFGRQWMALHPIRSLQFDIYLKNTVLEGANRLSEMGVRLL